MYDLISGDKTVAGAQHPKQTSQSIFRAGKFELHKWHSNAPSLEQPTPHEETIEERPTTHQNENQSYAKDQLGGKQRETAAWCTMGQTRGYNTNQFPRSDHESN